MYMLPWLERAQLEFTSRDRVRLGNLPRCPIQRKTRRSCISFPAERAQVSSQRVTPGRVGELHGARGGGEVVVMHEGQSRPFLTRARADSSRPALHAVLPYESSGALALARPTSPLTSRTLMPCGCEDDLVRTSLTTPSVVFPVLWSCFNTMRTRCPGLMSVGLAPSIRTSFQRAVRFIRCISVAASP